MQVTPRLLSVERPVRGNVWLSGPKILKKSQAGLPGPVGWENQKSAEKVEKASKSVKERLFRDFFGTFLALRADRPGKTFLRLFRHCGPGVRWRISTAGRKNRSDFRHL